MKFFTLIISATLLLTSSQAFSRDTKLMLSIDDAFQTSDFKDKLDPNIKFYFGDQKYSTSKQSYGTFVSNKKTNGVGKSDERACRWVFLSALLSLQERAKTEGGDSLVNVISYYKKNKMSSETEFECHAGNIMVGVALQGKVVKLGK